MLRVLKIIDRLLAKLFIFIIIIYQKTLSPDQGMLKVFFPHGFCRFHPHCSEYGKQALEKHNVITGIILALWRILRCNPWSKGGLDPIK
jgi:putative membrane protein insertion efficiency factor